MALIKIRGRLEPLEIENLRAQKVKNRKFGINGVEKAEPNEVVDLGDWAGEYSRIVEIELKKSRDVQPKIDEDEIKNKKEIALWLGQSAEVKGKDIARFKLAYSMKSGDFSKDPPEDVIAKAIEVQTKFYEENPKVRHYPSKVIEHLLPKIQAESIAEKMSVRKKPRAKCKSADCKNKIPENSTSVYCSGKCMLGDKNGTISTE